MEQKELPLLMGKVKDQNFDMSLMCPMFIRQDGLAKIRLSGICGKSIKKWSLLNWSTFMAVPMIPFPLKTVFMRLLKE